ncbi:MAG: hypothetical protein PVF57_17545 [Pseudomonadales bacterium]|jgi:hypothetical protein
MAKLVIEDLKEDKRLDERAMKAVAGGSAGTGLTGVGRQREAMRPGSLEESKLIRGLLKAPAATR